MCGSVTNTNTNMSVNINVYKHNVNKAHLKMTVQNDDCTIKHSRITALYVSLVTKGRLESPKCTFFGSV